MTANIGDTQSGRARDVLLRVAEALPKDAGRGLVRVDPQDLERLEVSIGDVVEIAGKRPTVARAMPAYADQRGQDLIQMDGILRANAGADHVGIVYNFHHGHGHVADFKEALAKMKPYLLCLNLNGMNDGARPKILPVGRGRHDKDMIRIVLDSG